MDKHLTFALAGGDMRQACLAGELARDGHRVTVSFLERAGEIPGALPLPAAEAFARADCIILPLPAMDRFGALNAPLSPEKPGMETLLRLAPPSALLCGGNLGEDFFRLAQPLGLAAEDYYKREELKIANAALTAEGAVQIAMEETDFALSGARALVVGYGRIGKLLANRLAALGARVTVSARKEADRAWARACGLAAADTGSLESVLPEQELVFNTVPAPVLGQDRLSLLRPDCLCVDLASKPGGVDFDAAARLGCRVVWALSLPGEAAPRSSGRAIRDTVYALLRERGAL